MLAIFSPSRVSSFQQMEISQISKKEYWNRTKIRVFHLHHWFESLSNTCFLGCYVNRCIHVGVPTILPVPTKIIKEV